MLADACYMACNAIFDPENGEWVQKNNQPVLFISTELDIEELTTMALAFLTGYNEEDILFFHFGYKNRIPQRFRIFSSHRFRLEVEVIVVGLVQMILYTAQVRIHEILDGSS